MDYVEIIPAMCVLKLRLPENILYNIFIMLAPEDLPSIIGDTIHPQEPFKPRSTRYRQHDVALRDVTKKLF